MESYNLLAYFDKRSKSNRVIKGCVYETSVI